MNLRAVFPIVFLPSSSLLASCILIPDVDQHGLKALESDSMLVGAWLGAWPADGDPVIDDFESMVDVRLHLVDVYLDWRTPFKNVSHTVAHVAAHGSLPILTWEAQTITTQDILQGTRMLPLRDGRSLTLDDYVAEFAQGACDAAGDSQQPVFLRVLHEMNGHWFAWGTSHETADGERPNTSESYRAAWIKIHQAFHGRCGEDVRFIWAINHFSVGDGASFMGAYPGDAYVDFVGIDGYNWGTRAEWGWQSFDTLFLEAYCAVVQDTSKPILIAEVASTERGGDKAAWIRDLFSRIQSYPQLRGLVWFNDAKFEIEINGNMDWQVNSSGEAREAFRESVQQLEGGSRTSGGTSPRC